MAARFERCAGRTPDRGESNLTAPFRVLYLTELGSIMRLRQVALVARDLDSVVDDLRTVLGIEVAFNDPGVGVFGLENAVMPIGDTFLEVVSPKQEDTTAGRFLQRRGGDGGYMVIFQVADLAAERARLEGLGVRIVWEVTLEDAATIHLHPRDVGGAIVSLDSMSPPDSWRWAGPDWKSRVRTDGAVEITGTTIQSDDPPALARRWCEVLGSAATLQLSGRQALVFVGSGKILFTPDHDGRGAGLSEIHLRVMDIAPILARARARGLVVSGEAFQACGVTFRLST